MRADFLPTNINGVFELHATPHTDHLGIFLNMFRAQDPAFVEEVKVRFAFFKGNQDFILNKIDAYAEQLQCAQQENNDKWQTIGQYVWPNPVVFDTYQEEVDHMKEWYVNRMNWLDSALDSL